MAKNLPGVTATERRVLNTLARMPAVKRWSILHQIRGQSLPEHCHNVARLAGLLADLLDLNSLERLELLELALRHDDDEIHSGDIPGPWKRENGVGKSPYATKIRAIMKVADYWDELLYLHQEKNLGNKFAEATIPSSEESLKRACAVLAPFIPDLPYLQLCNRIIGMTLVTFDKGLYCDD